MNLDSTARHGPLRKSAKSATKERLPPGHLPGGFEDGKDGESMVRWQQHVLQHRTWGKMWEHELQVVLPFNGDIMGKSNVKMDTDGKRMEQKSVPIMGKSWENQL